MLVQGSKVRTSFANFSSSVVPEHNVNGEGSFDDSLDRRHKVLSPATSVISSPGIIRVKASVNISVTIAASTFFSLVSYVSIEDNRFKAAPLRYFPEGVILRRSRPE